MSDDFGIVIGKDVVYGRVVMLARSRICDYGEEWSEVGRGQGSLGSIVVVVVVVVVSVMVIIIVIDVLIEILCIAQPI